MKRNKKGMEQKQVTSRYLPPVTRTPLLSTDVIQKGLVVFEKEFTVDPSLTHNPLMLYQTRDIVSCRVSDQVQSTHLQCSHHIISE